MIESDFNFYWKYETFAFLEVVSAIQVLLLLVNSI